MSQSDETQSRNFGASIIALSSVLVLVALMIGEIATLHLDFSVGFNIYSLLSFFSALTDLGVLILLIAKNRYSITTNWFMLFLGGATLNSLAEGLQRLSLHPGAALFWQNFSYLGLAILPPAFYLFIVSYTSQYKRQFAFMSSAIILTWGALAFFAADGLIFLHTAPQIDHAPWGYITTNSSISGVAILWFILLYILGVVLLLRFRKTARNRFIRRQVVIFIIAFILPFIAAFLTNVILPAAAPDIVPPLASFVGAFSGLLIYYGMRQYRLFDLDPQILAQNILDTMSEAVIIIRPDTTIESLNNEAERLLGVTTEAASNLKMQTFFSNRVWQLILEKLKNRPQQATDQLISKSEVRNSQGKVIPVRIAVTSLVDAGEKLASILVLSDISELTRSFDSLQESNAKLKELETQLRREKAGVEHTVEVRTKELTDAQTKLKATDQLKTEFVILTSHNLRTPLTIAKAYADQMSQYSLPKEEKEVVEGLQSGLKRLGEFVEDLLTINSIKAGDQLVLEEVSLQQIIEPLVQEATDLARARHNKFILALHAGDVQIKANVNRLQSAIRNLLNNASKYTENGTIELSTTRLKNKVLINISDTGIGIAKNELSKLFTEFHLATNVLTSSEESGEGIGLYITKLIVDEHGGKISVISQPKKGSTFSIELPTSSKK